MESANGYKVSFQVDENILILGYGDFVKLLLLLLSHSVMSNSLLPHGL